MTKPLELYTFGGLTIRLGPTAIESELALKGRALLVFLACDRRAHRRERLANLLWDRGDDRRLMANFRVLLSRLRRELAPYVIITRETVAFDSASAYWLDAAVLEQGLDASWRRRKPVGQPDPGDLEGLSQLLQLYRGDFLQGFHLRNGQGFAEWQLAEQERWRLQVLDALKQLVSAALTLGEYEQGLEPVRRWLELDPFNELAHRQAMELLARSGHWKSAEQQYRRCQELLAGELGIEPAPETTHLFEAIKARQLPPGPQDKRPVRVVMPVGIPTVSGQATSPAVFVGRRRQLETLHSALQIARSGRMQIRFVTGGAGRGKSMLVQEFGRQALLADPALLVVCGHGHDQTGQGDPYLPWREALAMLSGDVEGCACPIAAWEVQRLRAAMPVTIPALVAHAPALIGGLIPAGPLCQRASAIAPENVGWFERLQGLGTSESGPVLRQKDIFSQVAAWLKTVAVRQPLLLIVEDLHWADLASCGLLFYLSRHLAGSPVLLLGTYRPEELARPGQPLVRVVDELKRQFGDIRLDLGQLGAAEDRQFVADHLDSRPNRLPDSFREALFRQTGGHPLFTVELVQAIQARGELRQDKDGFWTMAAEGIDWQALPTQAEGVIEARLHRLPEALQNTLTIASVQGALFTAEVVARVQGRDRLAVIRQLSRALDRQQRLVHAGKPERVGGQRLSPYRFRHYLFQQYLYQRLDSLERIYLHEAVGTALEEIYGEQAEQVAVRLAYHFQAAGIADKAADYLLAGGKQAMRLGAYTEAATHLAGGLELLTSMPDSLERTRRELELQLTLGHALIATHGYAAPAIKDRFDRARTLCSQIGETPQLLPVSHALMVYYLMRAELPVAGQLAQQFLQQAGRLADQPAAPVGYRALGTISLFLGQLPAARQQLEQSISCDDPAQYQAAAAYYQSSSATGHASYAFALCLLGYPDQARKQVTAALRLAEAETSPIIKAQVLSFAAMTHAYRRDLPAAQQCAEAAIALTRQHEIVFWEAISRIILNVLRVVQGAAGLEIVADLRRELARYQATGARLGLPNLLYLVAEVLIRLDQPELAQERLAEALAIGQETGHRLFEPELYRLQGELLARQDAPAGEVEACFERAVALAREQEARWFELRATVGLCRLWAAEGRIEEANQKLAEIYDWFTEGFDTPDLVEARELLDSLHEARPEPASDVK